MVMREHGDRVFAIVAGYDVRDEAWMLELSEAGPAADSWADRSETAAHLPGQPFIVARVPDEDPTLEPTIYLGNGGGNEIPYEILRWFVSAIDDEIARCRAETDQDGAHGSKAG